MRSTLHDERGVVALIVAIIMVVMIGMSAMAIDFGFWWTSQRHLQTQVDAGALAGADQFLQNPASCPGNIKTVADQYAAPNTTTAGSDPVPSSNKQAGAEVGNVSANTTVACPGQGSYVDVSVQNTNPGVLFSGLNPTVTAHARVSLFRSARLAGPACFPTRSQSPKPRTAATI